MQEQCGGGHADELETSIMLYIDEQIIDMSTATRHRTCFVPGRLNRFDDEAPNYTPSGAMGDPRLATASKGKRLVEAMLRDGLELINDYGNETI